MSSVAEIAAELPKLSASELKELRGILESELGRKKVEWPDFEARRNRIFPAGPPPGKPLSEIVDEGRGDY